MCRSDVSLTTAKCIGTNEKGVKQIKRNIKHAMLKAELNQSLWHLPIYPISWSQVTGSPVAMFEGQFLVKRHDHAQNHQAPDSSGRRHKALCLSRFSCRR